MGTLISDKYAAWEQECEARFQQLKHNEEELNRIFIDIYGLCSFKCLFWRQIRIGFGVA